MAKELKPKLGDIYSKKYYMPNLWVVTAINDYGVQLAYYNNTSTNTSDILYLMVSFTELESQWMIPIPSFLKMLEEL